jgi:hypothetical protein
LALAVTAYAEKPDWQAKGNAKAKVSTAQKVAPRSNVRSFSKVNSGNARTFSANRFQNQTYSANRSAIVQEQTTSVKNNAGVLATKGRNFRSDNYVKTQGNLVVNRNTNFSVNRARDFNVARNNNTTTFNRERNFSAGQNFRTNRGNVAITNSWRGQQFSGQNYSAFRNYRREWHDRNWWNRNHSRITFYFGAPYYWDSGYWYPAWGYYPGYTYEYDGPIYGYNDLSPDQVVVDVQTQLQRDGYYAGPIDGVLGPITRAAIAQFQSDRGLAVTSSVDEPTLASLGLV